jgi:hypothetical protein
MVLSEINAAFTLIEHIKRLFKKPEPTVASRFVQLFEKHGVHRNQIPHFFGHGLTVYTVASDAVLLAALTEEMLNAACKLFAVRREWLDGVDTQIYPVHEFYKHPKGFYEFIVHLKNQSAGRVGGILFASDLLSRENDDAVIILEETIGSVGEKVIYRYHLCGGWLFNYWKCRVYLTACVAIAWKYKVYINGRKLPFKKLQGYLEGEKFLGEHYDGLIYRSSVWHPEDMACSPKNLLDGLHDLLYDGEYRQMINLWLALAEKGWMDTCFNPAPVEKFKTALRNSNILTKERPIK